MFALPTMAMGKKLDLSRLSDEEAQHVWQVVQRDFDLRKKEEDRLGDLKTKIEKEDTKLELLGTQSSLTESHCIRCLHPFKFLVNSKRQCLDCQMHTCKSCSSYNKKERGWVCDPCRMARVLKIGTLEWFHENVRSRFKRFGSAKVMRSLFKRLNGPLSSFHNNLRDGYEEPGLDDKDGGHYNGMKKAKKLLSVQPFDFNLDPNYSSHSRRQSYQTQSPLNSFEGVRRESMIAEAEIASMFQQIMEQDCEQEPEFNREMKHHENQRSSLNEEVQYLDRKPMQQPRSLSRVSLSSAGSGSVHGINRVVHLLGTNDSEEEEELGLYSPYHSHQRPHSQTSQDSLTFPAPPQITELNRRMSSIETLLNRLEQKVTTPHERAQAAHPQVPVSNWPLTRWEVADLEEQQLRQKLDQLTGNISDHALSSEDEEPKSPESLRVNLGQRSLKRPESREAIISTPPVQEPFEQTESQKVFQSSMIVDVPPAEAFHSTDLTRKGHHINSATAHLKGSTALLFELEDKVAEATASVQNTLSEVTDIENRIAALSAAGMTVEKERRKFAITLQTQRLSNNFPTSQADIFVRNSLYRGSLTQRSPLRKPDNKTV